MEAETASTGDQIDVLLLSLSINGCCGSHLTTAAGIEIQRRGVLLRQLAWDVGTIIARCSNVYTTKMTEDVFSELVRAMWESRWPSWAPVPNELYGFCGRKATRRKKRTSLASGFWTSRRSYINSGLNVHLSHNNTEVDNHNNLDHTHTHTKKKILWRVGKPWSCSVNREAHRQQ